MIKKENQRSDIVDHMYNRERLITQQREKPTYNTQRYLNDDSDKLKWFINHGGKGVKAGGA
jgi:hypothetical protein